MTTVRTPPERELESDANSDNGELINMNEEIVNAAKSSSSSLEQDQFQQLMHGIGALHGIINELRQETNINKQEITSLKEQLQKTTPSPSVHQATIPTLPLVSLESTSHTMPANMNTIDYDHARVSSINVPQINLSASSLNQTNVLSPLPVTANYVPPAISQVFSHDYTILPTNYASATNSAQQVNLPTFTQNQPTVSFSETNHAINTTLPSFSYNQPILSLGSQVYTPQPNITASSQVRAHMPQYEPHIMPLPTFNGNAEDWPLFLASFTESTNEMRYSNKQNLVRLHKALQGRAREAVSAMLIYPEEVPNIISELQFNFGRPELIIKSQLEKVQNLPAISENRTELILTLSNRVQNITAFFKAANCEQHLVNPLLMEQLVSKLPPSKQYEWSKYSVTLNELPTIRTFAQWIAGLARVVAIMPSTNNNPTQSDTKHNTSRVNPVRRVLHSHDTKQNYVFKCIQCAQNHKLIDCKQFEELNIDERWTIVKTNNLCFGCLRKGHSLSDCRSKKRCAKDNCARYHHTLLHNPNISDTTGQKTPVKHVLACNKEQNDRETSLYKMIEVTLHGPKGKVNVWAMFDEAASISIIESNVVANLGLTGPYVPLTLQWIDNNTITENSKKVSCEISGIGQNKKFYMRNIYTVNKLLLPIQTFRKEDYEHTNNLPVSNYTEVKPSILIGLDNSYLATPRKIIMNGQYMPIATETELGWLVFGPTNTQSTPEPHVLHIRKAHTLDQLAKLIEDNYSIENFGLKDTDAIMDSDENIYSKEILEKTTKKIGERYEVGLLWKEANVQLPDNYKLAEKRLLTLETKMSKNPPFAEKYKNEINKYIAKNYARELKPEEIHAENSRIWYLPHFGVVNPHKPEKLRVVFDAAADLNGVSLNSKLSKGPEQAQPLLKILYQFRQGTIAVAGDVQEMFSQVRIKDEDQQAQRFLWRDGNTGQEIKVFAMTTMIFGATCSPCCAEFIKNRNAEQFRKNTPKGADAVIKSMYVDDLVISFDNEDEALKITNEAITINAAAGFKLRNFVSNSKIVQDSINGHTTCQGIINMEPQAKPDKILGMFWNTATDNLEFHFKFHRIANDVLICKRTPTKRELLGIAMAIYDPFGFLTNVTISIKLILQATWKAKVQWDDELPNELAKQWYQWWNAFQAVAQLTVPRCYSKILRTADNIQLHVFVDASSNAYAAVAYLRIQRADIIEVVLVGSKGRCAPIKQVTIPRLELQAAVLGCLLKESIIKSHDFEIQNVQFWCDSTTVIQWIKSTTRQFKQFVAHRIAKITTLTHPDQWHWLPTKLNIADEATRFRPIFQAEPTIWIKGPGFLQQPEECWPQGTMEETLSAETEAEEIKRLLVTKLVQNIGIDYSKYSSYEKLKRVTSWVMRYIANLKKFHTDNEKETGELQVSELNKAEIYLCKQVQVESFGSQIETLKNKEKLPKSSSLYALTPFIDENGLVRIDGRIDAAYCLPESARRPIILAKEHYITFLIVMEYHIKRHHQNDALVINELRQKFWIPQVRALQKRVKQKCLICAYLRSQPATPRMGQLPLDRVTPFVRPFTYTGVDYCGPFLVAIGRRQEKRWIALFTCLTVRAVHLEIAENLSTDAFLICLRNFVNRRGVPCRIRCDNGTNFIGAHNKLKTENEFFDLNYIQRELGKMNIEWKFNCPLNPNAGGCWERLIQCVKRLLQRALKSDVPRVETLRSVLIEAENIINSRPLTEIPVTPQEPEPLTPNHFLLGCLNSTQTPSKSEDICLRKQWKIAQNLKDRLWKQWVCEYLPRLICRSKWREEVTPLKPGQIVLILDHTTPRSHWKRGVIEDVITANDGQVRSAIVKTSQGILRRPASKLAALNISESE